MIDLDDCGKDIVLNFGGAVYSEEKVKVIMVIKVPRGTMALFDRNYISPDTQCDSIRAFVDGCKDD